MSNKVYEIITQNILDELRKNVIPWQQPWTPELSPQNVVSKKPYRGVNALLLSLPARHFGCPYFATYRQINQLGGRVRNDDYKKPLLVAFWRWVKKECEETGQTEVIPFLRYYRVWNLAQTEKISWELPEVHENDPIHECEQIVQTYQEQGGPAIENDGGSHAYYSLTEDEVHVPTADRFIDSYSYYSVLFHELTHSTGHFSRLNRGLSSAISSRNYAREELTAELGAAFLLGSAGLTEDIPVSNSTAYIQHWMQALKDDPRCVVFAASRAQKAADYVLGKRQSQKPQNEEYHEAA